MGLSIELLAGALSNLDLLTRKQSLVALVLLYSSAEEFLSCDRLQDISLISDVGLPGMDGIKLLRVVRSRCPGLPVIIITARSEPEDIGSGVECGCLPGISKTN